MEGNGQLAGYLAAEGGTFRRNRHAAYITAGVRQRYAGQGVGLYRRLGFVIEGTRRDSLRVDENIVDEYAMAKLLDG